MYKVLLIEDEDLIRKGLMFMADWQSHNCFVVGEAINGVDGLSKIKELKPDIVIVDINMPEMDGLCMLEKGLTIYDFQAIIISGYSNFDYAKKAISLGVTEYLLKPVDYAKLYTALEKVTSIQRKKEQLRQGLQQIHNEKIKLGLLPCSDSFSSKKFNPHVQLLLNKIANDYRSSISLTNASDEYGMSCTYLNLKFKKETGYTFNDYLNRYRIQKAIDLLNQDSYRIYEIADLVGFSDYKYFIKVFRKYTGYTPRAFHKKIQTFH